MSTLSRRKALASMGAVPLAVAIPAALASHDGDAELLALWTQFGELERAYCAASYEADLTEQRATPPTPEILEGERLNAAGEMTPIRLLCEDDICATFQRERHILGALEAERRRTERRAAAAKWRADKKRACEAAGLPAMEAAAGEIGRAAYAIIPRIIDTPASGVLGLAIKLKAWRFEQEVFAYVPGDRDGAVLVSALRDAERLSRRLPMHYYCEGGEAVPDSKLSETTVAWMRRARHERAPHAEGRGGASPRLRQAAPPVENRAIHVPHRRRRR